jgi:5'-nucleotidase
MAYPIERKLVVAIASSALFDLSECDQVFKEKGEEAYRKYQRENQKRLLPRLQVEEHIGRLNET